ncbi:MAG: isocitrate lyase/phosphoenolpyruvate mutase family protein [Candidatus Atribacteria bacterium]|nr:MAG: isocitrate lyase/phosphoenolpyruvate mutase family protein [Candidatus Atribacteria bacterium]
MIIRQFELAQQFRSLHEDRSVLLLPNVWDVVSAKLYENLGFSAIGTTSAGIAATLGLPDGQQMSIESTVRVIQQIARLARIPISADIEAGYADTPEGVADAAEAVIQAGAVGINLEDSLSACGADHYAGLIAQQLQEERIAAVRERADSMAIPLFINARVDALLIQMPSPEAAIEEAIARGNAYLRAGADGVFVPDMGDLAESSIQHLAREIHGPLNLIAGAATPPVATLRELGIARLSFGPRPMRTALWHLQEMAREWQTSGSYTRMLEGKLSYTQVNEWFTGCDGCLEG